jgi:hypothetical protein
MNNATESRIVHLNALFAILKILRNVVWLTLLDGLRIMLR